MCVVACVDEAVVVCGDEASCSHTPSDHVFPSLQVCNKGMGVGLSFKF